MSMNFLFYCRSVSQSGCKYTTAFLLTQHLNQKKIIFLKRLPHTPILQLVTVNKKFAREGEKYRPRAKRLK
jgi:hypothetical protein